MITTKFCTWHDSCAVIPCVKFCCDMIINNLITAKWNFRRILIVMENLLVKWGMGLNVSQSGLNLSLMARSKISPDWKVSPIPPLDSIYLGEINTRPEIRQCSDWTFVLLPWANQWVVLDLCMMNSSSFGGSKMAMTSQMIIPGGIDFQMHFCEWNVLYFD